MKHSFTLSVAALLLALSAPVFAEDGVHDLSTSSPQAASAEPLMVIRFNQPNVDYAMPLYNTLSQALEVKPGATFEVVSVSPKARVEHNQPYYDRLAAENSDKVVATMHKIGMPDRRIKTSNTVDTVDASEVRIYVH